LYEKLRGKNFELDKEVTSVGRKDSVDIQLADGSVSSHHADIIRTERDGEVCYILRDNDSTNGTKVNNEPVTEQVLKNSDLITFGHVEVLFDCADGKEEEGMHFTHTIDLGSATTNTTTTQTLTNFSARMMDEKKKNARTNQMMNMIIIAGGILVLGIVIFTFIKGFSN
jgi:pSer/pThr/pTyr-binding forkhead associated (FHA) protein